MITNPEFLKTDQYKSSNNLNARIALHARFSTNNYGWQQWVFDHLILQEGERVFEAGCGSGSLWIDRCTQLPSGVAITLGDFSIGMLHAARQVLPACIDVSYCNTDIQALPLPSQAFDCAIANHMLYHVADIARGVAELGRVLKQHGRAIVATNGDGHLAELEQLIQEVEPSYTMESTRRFTLENGGSILEKVFKKVTLERYDDALWVTETIPLLDYIYSLWDVKKALREHRSQELADHIAQRIQRDGGIFIRKKPGLFICKLTN
jgi:ubiquinone/menaquinone biosynthesis C-methylase UbiE